MTSPGLLCYQHFTKVEIIYVDIKKCLYALVVSARKICPYFHNHEITLQETQAKTTNIFLLSLLTVFEKQLWLTQLYIDRYLFCDHFFHHKNNIRYKTM